MLELNIFKNNNRTSVSYGKYYAHVEYKKTMSIHDMALHMAEHNTPFSVGTIEGILRDFVNCTREQCLNGNTVKIDNLAIFKCSVQANGLPCVLSTEVPRDVYLTDLLRPVSLDDPVQWIELICDAERIEPLRYASELQKKGFDCETVMKRFMYLYEREETKS